MEAHTLSRGLRYSRFGIEGVATRHTIAGGKWSDVAEIVVTGPSPARNNAARARSVVAMMPAALARIVAVFG
jgi:hypothetical protein